MKAKFKPPTKGQRKRFSKYLAPGEKIILATGISNTFFWSMFFRFFLASFLIFGIPHLAALIRKKLSFHYVLTDKRCLIIEGIFSRKLITAPLSAITHVTVEQSLTDRLFYHCGNIVVITAGYDPREIVIENVAHPVDFKILMDHLSGTFDDKEHPLIHPVGSKVPIRHLKLSNKS